MIRAMAEGARFFSPAYSSKLFKLGRTLPGASLAFVAREASVSKCSCFQWVERRRFLRRFEPRGPLTGRVQMMSSGRHRRGLPCLRVNGQIQEWKKGQKVTITDLYKTQGFLKVQCVESFSFSILKNVLIYIDKNILAYKLAK